MSRAQNKPEAGRETASDLRLRFYCDTTVMWNAGCDTRDITGHFGLPESLVYKHIENIKKAAWAVRSARSELPHNSVQNHAHTFKSHTVRSLKVIGGVVATGEIPSCSIRPPPPLIQINHIRHSSVSIVRSVSQIERNNGETACLKKVFANLQTVKP